MLLLTLLLPLYAADALSVSSGTISNRVTPPASTSALSHNQKALANMPQFPRTWVPLGSVFELDGSRPNKVEFMGQSYVCYQNDPKDTNSWSVVDDACPHRLAPLSEGRIVHADANGNEIKLKDLRKHQDDAAVTKLVECAYHGWAFDKHGKCVRIPQATLELQQRTIQSNPKSHVQAYSTQVVKNVIFAWIWPEDCLQFTDVSETSNQHAWRQPQHMLANLGGETTTYTRDLPYGWDTLLENIVDPAHVPWAHHGLQGSRQDSIAINMTTSNSMSEQGFSYEYQDRTLGMLRAGFGHFRAPYVISYEAQFQPKEDLQEARPFNLTAVMIPTKPGWSRIIIHSGAGSRGYPKKEEEAMAAVSTQAKKKKDMKTNLLFLIVALLPTWLSHQLSNRFLDSDLAFLHYQEQERLVKRQVDFDGYCMPAPADRCIAALRKWIRQYAHIPTTRTVAGVDDARSSGGGSREHDDHGSDESVSSSFQQPLLPESPLDKSLLFDRWSQHSDQCKYCHGALDGVKVWRRNSLFVMAASVLLAKFTLARIAVVACLAVLKVLSMVESSILKGGFDHYKNH
ncbi:hypothetical protein MPSEU_000768200 [Mayamaea pseudoterrestris]|nr:hypothetical protein MPSEU_000768200 [Mayamaea pseudoterrestris]